MRTRGVLLSAFFLLAAAGCAGQEPSVFPGGPPSAAPPSAPPPWSEPAAYKFAFRSDCGAQPLQGTFRATVENGAVTGTEGLDEAAKRALMLRIANIVPTLGGMVDQAEAARAAGETVTVENDPVQGYPTDIRIGTEACYEITEYTIGGQPGPSASPSR